MHLCIPSTRSPSIRQLSFRHLSHRSVSTQLESTSPRKTPSKPQNSSKPQKSSQSPNPPRSPRISNASKHPKESKSFKLPTASPDFKLPKRRFILNEHDLLDSKLTLAERKKLYEGLATLPARQLAQLFHQKLRMVRYEKELRPIFLKAASYWTADKIKAVMKEWGEHNMQLRLDLFTNNLLQKYTVDRNITSIIDCLPLKGKPTNLMPFYNAILSLAERHKEYEHVRLVLDVMKERDIKPDTATYNVLLRISLTQNRNMSGVDIYHRLVAGGLVPNQATYNILIKHAVQHKQWDTLDQWLDFMHADQLEPTQVTARILFRALAKYPLEEDLSKAFDRVSHTITLEDKEKLINISASVRIKSNQPTDAIDIINKAIESNEPISVYTYNLLLSALCSQGQVEEAQQVLESMISSSSIPKPDIISFTTVIHGLVRHSHTPDMDAISRLYKQLGEQGLHTNNVLQSVILYGLLKTYDLDSATKFFNTAIKTKDQPYIPQQLGDQRLSEIQIYNMMIDFYFRYYRKSKELKHTTPQQPFDLLKEAIVQKNLKPTESTLNIMLRGLKHKKVVNN